VTTPDALANPIGTGLVNVFTVDRWCTLLICTASVLTSYYIVVLHCKRWQLQSKKNHKLTSGPTAQLETCVGHKYLMLCETEWLIKETVKLLNRYIAIFITKWKTNCSHQMLGAVFPLTTNMVISVSRYFPGDHHIGCSVLLQFTWQRGHYTSQQIVRDGFITLHNSPF
jgi:hypothetical protein